MKKETRAQKNAQAVKTTPKKIKEKEPLWWRVL
jgi:hypothetical protein